MRFLLIFMLGFTIGAIIDHATDWLVDHSDVGYSQQDIAMINDIAVRTRPLTFKQRQAHALSNVYGISFEKAAKPVNLYGE